MANAPKVYDFPMAKVEGQLVSFLKQKRGESTVADMIAGTGLPKYQVEQAAKAALDEYAGRLKVTESGELLYYFPDGMRSTVRGAGPRLRRFWKAFKGTAARVFTLLFKIWIVAMLVGYFVAFVGPRRARHPGVRCGERRGQGRQPGQRQGPRRRLRRHVPRHAALRPDPPDVVLVEPPQGPAQEAEARRHARSTSPCSASSSVTGIRTGDGTSRKGSTCSPSSGPVRA